MVTEDTGNDNDSRDFDNNRRSGAPAVFSNHAHLFEMDRAGSVCFECLQFDQTVYKQAGSGSGL